MVIKTHTISKLTDFQSARILVATDLSVFPLVELTVRQKSRTLKFTLLVPGGKSTCAKTLIPQTPLCPHGTGKCGLNLSFEDFNVQENH